MVPMDLYKYEGWRHTRIRYFFISGGQETGVLKVGGMAAFVMELAFYIEGQKCESGKTQWKEKDRRDRQVV